MQEILKNALEQARPATARGQCASYIPELTKANPDHLGISVRTIDGRSWHVGDCGVRFTIQSISKIITLILAFEKIGYDAVFSKVGIPTKSGVGDGLLSVADNRMGIGIFGPALDKKGNSAADFDDLERKIREENVKVYMLCSPHNPVGRVWQREELEKMGELCGRHGLTVVADEIHCDFTREGYTHIPFLKACPQLAEQTILCTAPSKTFNLAGLEASNIFIPGQALRRSFIGALHSFGCYNPPNVMGLIACRAAYESGEAWHLACRDYMEKNLAFLRDFVRDKLPGITLVEPEGTYFAWLDFSALGLSSEEIDRRILHGARVWLDNGVIFGTGGEQRQRVSLSCTRATLTEALERIQKAFEDDFS